MKRKNAEASWRSLPEFSRPLEKVSGLGADVSGNLKFNVVIAPSEGPVVWEGELSKRPTSGRGTARWRNRYFVVRDSCIFYYRSHSEFDRGLEPRGTIAFDDVAEVREDTAVKGKKTTNLVVVECLDKSLCVLEYFFCEMDHVFSSNGCRRCDT